MPFFGLCGLAIGPRWHKWTFLRQTGCRKSEFVVRRDIESRIGPHFGPQSGEIGSKMAVNGLGGVVYQSRCRRAVLIIVSEVGSQTGSRLAKPEVVFPVQEMARNARTCVVTGLRSWRMPVFATFRTAGQCMSFRPSGLGSGPTATAGPGPLGGHRRSPRISGLGVRLSRPGSWACGGSASSISNFGPHFPEIFSHSKTAWIPLQNLETKLQLSAYH